MIGFILLALPIVVLSVAISYFALFLWGLKKNGQLNIFHKKEKKPNTILEDDRRQSFENNRIILNIGWSNLDYLKLQDELKDIDVEIEKMSKEIRIVDNRETFSNTFDLVKKEILQTNNQSSPKRTTRKNKAFIMDLNESVTSMEGLYANFGI